MQQPIPSRGDVAVLERPDATYVLRVRGTEVAVLVVVPTRLVSHREIVARVLVALDRAASAPPSELPIERLPIPERAL